MINTGNEDDSDKTDQRRLNFTYYPTEGSYIYNPVHNEWPLGVWVGAYLP